MSDDNTIEFKNQGMIQLMKAFKGQMPNVRVGILGSSGKSARHQDDFSKSMAKPTPTNAEVGAAHEFGTSKLPRRSFLRMPLSQNLEKALENAGAFDEEKLKEVIKSGKITAWMKKVAVTAEKVVGEAFATGGFGQWKPSKMDNKNLKQTLVETRQLRDSITSEVKE